MRHRLSLLAVIVMCVLLKSGPAAAQDVVHPVAGSPLRAQLLDAARPAFESETKGSVEFVVRQLNVWQEWAFGDVTLQRPAGRPIDWRKTKFADDFKNGYFDPAGSFFLLKREDGRWTVVKHVVGPTDIAWDAWRIDYHLPDPLFERPNAK